MKIALCQMNALVGDIKGNLKKALRFLKKAKRQGVQLAVFPELTFTGYPPQDLLLLPDFVRENQKSLHAFAKECKGISAFVGVAEKRDGALFNSAVLCKGGKVVENRAKCLLPNYDVFDEERYFDPGPKPEPVEFDGQKWGVHLCEDLWDANYNLKVCDSLSRKGAQVFVNLSCSPFTLGKTAQRLSLAAAKAKKFKIPFVYVNLVGGQDEIIFDGNSFVLDEKGRLVAQARAFEEDLLVVDLDALPISKKFKKPVLEEEAFKALVLGLKDYLGKNGFSKCTLGLSGGVDSALVAALASEALGPENVLGVLLPSKYTSKASSRDAILLAKNLSIETVEMPIEPAVELNRKQFKKTFGKYQKSETEENLQARERGKVLMQIANDSGALLLSTSNKTEAAVGYATLYGDMCGGLAPISDLDKLMVYRLCRFMNERTGKNIIPLSTLTKAPTAELRPNQKDEDSLPPYEILVPLVEALVEDRKSPEALIKAGYSKKTVRWIYELVRKSEFKRRQAAPGLKITKKAFGQGRRFPMTNGWRG